MKKIDDYINSIYKNFKDNNREIEELKLDMENHLLEVVEELKREGYSEEESIDIAIERFGDSSLIEGELSGVIKEKKNNNLELLLLSLTFFPIVYLLGEYGEFKGAALIVILVPVYTIYEIIRIYNKSKKKIEIEKVHEATKYLFIIYLVILGAKILFPLNVYPDLSKSTLPSIDLIPFSDLEFIKQYPSEALKNRSILAMYFIPLGFLTPVLNHKFRSIKSIVLLTVVAFIIRFFLVLIFGILGMSRGYGISINTLLIYLTGTLIGYALYISKEKYSKLKVVTEV